MLYETKSDLLNNINFVFKLTSRGERNPKTSVEENSIKGKFKTSKSFIAEFRKNILQ